MILDLLDKILFYQAAHVLLLVIFSFGKATPNPLHLFYTRCGFSSSECTDGLNILLPLLNTEFPLQVHGETNTEYLDSDCLILRSSLPFQLVPVYLVHSVVLLFPGQIFLFPACSFHIVMTMME